MVWPLLDILSDDEGLSLHVATAHDDVPVNLTMGITIGGAFAPPIPTKGRTSDHTLLDYATPGNEAASVYLGMDARPQAYRGEFVMRYLAMAQASLVVTDVILDVSVRMGLANASERVKIRDLVAELQQEAGDASQFPYEQPGYVTAWREDQGLAA
jgi:hypothetical protein